MRVFVLCSSLTLAGCGSYWDLREGEKLPYGCAGNLNWYLDADNDGWGDPGATPTPGCEPPAGDDATYASNNLDCDDSDPGITGQAGAICPDGMGVNANEGVGSPCVEGVTIGNSEFVSTCGESPLVSYTMAEGDCLSWAGWLTPEAVAEGATGQHGLAALETDFEYNQVLDQLLETAAAGQPMAVWVDLRWNGDLTTGSWEWPDPAGGAGIAPTWIQPCNGVETVPADFYPDLSLAVPDAAAKLTDALPHLRQALVYDGSTWCRGTPDAMEGPFGPREAYAICERPRPDVADYADVPDDEGGGAEE